VSRADLARGALLVVALGVIFGLAAVQSLRYLHDFITYPTSPAVMYLVAAGCGVVAGWAIPTLRGVLILPPLVVLIGALVFFLVAYSPVWLGGSRHDVAVVNELLRQMLLILLLGSVACYFGAIAGLVAAEARQ
jgi:hypothetical protein